MDAAESFRFDEDNEGDSGDGDEGHTGDNSESNDRRRSNTLSLQQQQLQRPTPWYDVWMQAYLDRLEQKPLTTKAITCSLVSALGALWGNLSTHNQTYQHRRQHVSDSKNSTTHSNSDSTSMLLYKISEICAFALYGGLIGGPLTHYWNEWLEQKRQKNSASSSNSSSWNLLLDQLVAQPPMLFLMHLVLDMVGAGVRQIPYSWNRALERTGPSVVLSWRYWPIVMYIM